jgi:hypothetical protein
MSEAGENRPWRAAFITTIVSISLTPLAAMVGYYSSKALAAPKLSVQYADAIPETAPLTIDKSLGQVVRHIIESSEQPSAFPAASPYFEPGCVQQLGSGSVALDCAKQFRAGIPQLLDSMDYYKSVLVQDRQAIEAWDGRSELSLTPLYLPEFQSLEEAAASNKPATINVLHNNEKLITDERVSAVSLMATLSDFIGAPEKRTGKVSFKVGVLNSGDSDGVIFPSAKLSAHNFDVSLRNTSPFVAAPWSGNFNPNGSFNVIRAHSFLEVNFIVDETKTLPSAQDSWRAAVKNGTQDDYTIELKTSGSPIVGKGQLPP